MIQTPVKRLNDHIFEIWNLPFDGRLIVEELGIDK